MSITEILDAIREASGVLGWGLVTFVTGYWAFSCLEVRDED